MSTERIIIVDAVAEPFVTKFQAKVASFTSATREAPRRLWEP